MSTLGDIEQKLKDGLTKLQTDLTAKLKELEDKIQNSGISDADKASFQESIDAIGKLDDQVNAEGTTTPPVA